MQKYKPLLILILCVFVSKSYAQEVKILECSWYSVASLKSEGTYKYSRGIMANGEIFNDSNFTCANRLYPLGSVLQITNLENNKSVIVVTTDRIGKRFANMRVDLSKEAFRKIADLDVGIIKVRVEWIK